ncbi:MAG: glycine--tRNA ligase, partial [Methanosarcinales archaeon]
MESPTIGIEEVFVASGHVSGFSDPITECKKCKEAFRADHLINNIVEVPDTLTPQQIKAVIQENNIKCPECGGELGEVQNFNLMFKTSIGPGSKKIGYLRPETAQGIFINFSRLLRFYREKIPFGVTQIGKAYRNEISPRQGVIRLREFTQAEAEIFINPKDKNHPKFKDIKNLKLRLYSEDAQKNNKGISELTVQEAVNKGIIANEYLGYNIALTHLFLIRVGISENKLRFRQHQSDEMAHYAADCWDAEVLTALGWIEVVGIADRTDYDLSEHAKYSGTDLSIFVEYPEPKKIEKLVIKPRMDIIGPRYKKRSGAILKELKNLSLDELSGEYIKIKVDGEEIKIDKDLIEYETVQEEVRGETIIPHVIEPSYGIDRILYAILEHSFSIENINEELEERIVLRLPSEVAPVQVAVLPLLTREELIKPAKYIETILRKNKILVSYDDSGTIGRRYRRQDEIGTPFAITIDYETLEDDTVTIRDRDTMKQIRVKIADLPEIM